MCDRSGRFIVPISVLRRLADDESFPAESRQAMRDCVAVEEAWRGLRNAHSRGDHSPVFLPRESPVFGLRVCSRLSRR